MILTLLPVRRYEGFSSVNVSCVRKPVVSSCYSEFLVWSIRVCINRLRIDIHKYTIFSQKMQTRTSEDHLLRSLHNLYAASIFVHFHADNAEWWCLEMPKFGNLITILIIPFELEGGRAGSREGRSGGRPLPRSETEQPIYSLQLVDSHDKN